jgi:hypothetical protein
MTRILFVGSNPGAVARSSYGTLRAEPVLRVRDFSRVAFSALDLAGELADVRAELARGGQDRIQLYALEHATVDDVIRALAQLSADVVHFSGHGTPNGLVFASGEGTLDLSGTDFSTLLQALGQRRVRLVVLNACYSETQAAALLGVSEFVIGTEHAIGDANARTFSRNLYFCLASGNSLADAMAVADVAAAHNGKPRLLKREGADPACCYFARPREDGWDDPQRGNHEVLVLGRADADEQLLHQTLARASASSIDRVRDQLRIGAVALHRLSEAAAARHFTALQTAGALVTRVFRRAEDDIEFTRDQYGIWFGAVPMGRGRRSWLSIHPITREQYASQLKAQIRPNERLFPQDRVTWHDAVRFCDELSRAGQSARRYRLPTREEWLSASTDQRALVENRPEMLLRLGRVRSDCTTRVGTYPPSERGFLDLVGNVAEWTSSAEGNKYVSCGGSFRSNRADFPGAWVCSVEPTAKADWLGFRVAFDAEAA